jgi:hypothetical protein
VQHGDALQLGDRGNQQAGEPDQNTTPPIGPVTPRWPVDPAVLMPQAERSADNAETMDSWKRPALSCRV